MACVDFLKKCLQNGLLQRKAPAFQKKTVNHPMQTYTSLSILRLCHFTSRVSWYSRSAISIAYERAKVLPFLSVRVGMWRVIPRVCPGSRCLCPPVSSPLCVFAKSLSNVPRDLSFTLKCLSLFNNTLFVDQWPFSVALLQFGVYLSLILAIKSFAFETHWLRPFHPCIGD